MVLEQFETIGLIGIIFEISGFVLMIKFYGKKPTEDDWKNWKTRNLVNKGILTIEDKDKVTIEMANAPKGLKDDVHRGFVTYWNFISRYLPIGLVIFGLVLQGIQLLAD